MNDNSINIVSVRCCCESDGVDAHARLETEDGGAMNLRLTPEAIDDFAACCSVASIRANAQPANRIGIPAMAESVAPLAAHVLMALSVADVGIANFVLSHEDAVVLAAQLLDAAKASMEHGGAPPQ